MKRIYEINACDSFKILNTNDYPKLDKNHESGPLVASATSPQYKAAVFKDFKVTNTEPNNCCLLKCGKIISIQNFAFENNQPVLIGFSYKKIK